MGVWGVVSGIWAGKFEAEKALLLSDRGEVMDKKSAGSGGKAHETEEKAEPTRPSTDGTVEPTRLKTGGTEDPTRPKTEAEVVQSVLDSIQQRVKVEEIKATLGDFIRLLQLRRELEEDELREVDVTWKDPSEEEPVPEP